MRRAPKGPAPIPVDDLRRAVFRAAGAPYGEMWRSVQSATGCPRGQAEGAIIEMLMMRELETDAGAIWVAPGVPFPSAG